MSLIICFVIINLNEQETVYMAIRYMVKLNLEIDARSLHFLLFRIDMELLLGFVQI